MGEMSREGVLYAVQRCSAVHVQVHCTCMCILYMYRYTYMYTVHVCVPVHVQVPVHVHCVHLYTSVWVRCAQTYM